MNLTNQRRTLVLKAYLSRCSQEKMALLERFLPQEEQQRLSALPPLKERQMPPRGSLLEEVHWSWFLPTLKSYPEREQGFFLHCLSGTAEHNLQQELNLFPAQEVVNPSGCLFLRQVLLHSLIGTEEQLIPKDYLPPSPLNVLSTMGKKGLVHLIDYLSLYDLAHEVRQIVETKILKKIYSFLSEEEKRFLKVIPSNKEPYAVPRMGLEKWDKTEAHFRHLLHKRGLARLGAALSGQDPDLIWYVCHQLDIGRGTSLYKSCAKERMPVTSEWVARQIEELLIHKEISS